MADLIVPPWLQYRPQPNPIEAYTGGAEIGLRQRAQQDAEFQAAQRVALAQQAQAQQAEETGQRIDLARQEEYRREQEAAIADQYRQQQYGLQQAEEQRKQQQSDIAVQAAARQFQAQQNVKAMIDQGVPVEKAVLTNAIDLGMSGKDIVALNRQSLVSGPVQAQSVLDPITHVPMPGFIATPNPSGTGFGTHINPAFVQGELVKRQAETAKRMKEQARQTLLLRQQTEYSRRIANDRLLPKNDTTKKLLAADETKLKQIEDELESISPAATPAPADSGTPAPKDDPLGLFK